ncbi:MAG: type I restriction enzyme HsdR N-terminal domain-containing protein [Moorellales bacterium]
MARRGGQKDLTEVIEEIKGAIESTPKRAKRILCKTLLKECGFQHKTRERAEMLMKAFAEAKITVTPSLVDCGRDDWITLSLIDPQVPVEMPEAEMEAAVAELDVENDPWFDEILTKNFDSEREVEIRFILPLLERLGYTEDDRADGYSVEIYEGVRKAVKEADFVLFDGRNRSKDNALMVIEAKAMGKKLADYVGQARTYAIWLGTPYYLVTNGDEIRVFLYRSPIESDVEVFTGNRRDLKSSFRNLYNLVSKRAIVEYQRRKKSVIP